jgi:hypothetical protein
MDRRICAEAVIEAHSRAYPTLGALHLQLAAKVFWTESL